MMRSHIFGRVVTFNVVAVVLLPVLVNTGAAVTSWLLLYNIHACSMCSVGKSWHLEYVHSRPSSSFSLSLLTSCVFARFFWRTLLKLVYICCCKAYLYVVGAFSTMMRSVRKCRSVCSSEYRIADLEGAQSRIFVLVRMRPRGSGVAVYAPVAEGSKNLVVKSDAKGISIRSVSTRSKSMLHFQ